MNDINIQKELEIIDKRLAEMREEYLQAKPNRKRFIAVAANLLKEKRVRLSRGVGL